MRILVLGDFIIDETVFCTVFDNPDSPIVPMVQPDCSRTYGLGGAANLAINLATLGATVEFPKLLTQLDFKLSSDFTKHNVNLIDKQSLLLATNNIYDSDIDSDISPYIVKRYIDKHTGRHLLRCDMDYESKPYQPFKNLVSIDFFNKLNKQYECIVIADYELGTIDSNTLETLRKYFDGPIYVDSRNTSAILDPKCNKKFKLLKLNFNEWDSFKKGLRHRFQDIIVTDAAGARRVGYDGFRGHKVKVADSTGAGDTFLAALIVAHEQRGYDLADSIRWANAASAVSISKLGISHVTPEEVNKMAGQTFKRSNS